MRQWAIQWLLDKKNYQAFPGADKRALQLLVSEKYGAFPGCGQQGSAAAVG